MKYLAKKFSSRASELPLLGANLAGHGGSLAARAWQQLFSLCVFRLWSSSIRGQSSDVGRAAARDREANREADTVGGLLT